MGALATFEATAAAIATLGISVLCGMFLLRAALRVLEGMVSARIRLRSSRRAGRLRQCLERPARRRRAARTGGVTRVGGRRPKPGPPTLVGVLQI